MKNKVFSIIGIIALVVLLALTAREAAAISDLLSNQMVTANRQHTGCESLPFRYSIRAEFVKDINTWMTFTEDGPTGIDGGLIHLLSAYRACSP